VIDVFSRMIVGWQLAANMRNTLVLDALRMALGLREHGADVRLVAHSDAGSQGGFNRSSQRSMKEGCDGQAERMGVTGDGAAGDAFAGAAAGGASGASSAVLGGDRSWRDECRRRGGGWRVGDRWRPVVPGGWRDAVTLSLAPLSGRYLSFAEREEITILRAGGCGCGRSRASSVARRRRSPGSFGGTPRAAAAVSSIGRRLRSGMRTDAAGGRSPRSWPPIRSCGVMCRTGYPVLCRGLTG